MSGPRSSIRALRWLPIAAAAGLATFTLAPARAHEVRPGYLELAEREPGRFAVLWKVPAMGGAVLRLEPTLPPECATTGGREVEATESARVERWTVDCGASGLTSGTISINGLSRTLTDVLVRIQRLDGAPRTALLRAAAPELRLDAEASPSMPVAAYLRLGVEHILFGIDHLLFVLALLLIIGPRWRMLIKTITAFTVAHSVTLALATLGVVRIPQAPVEAAIALSIMFVAAEILHARSGHPGLTARAPWIVAFSFGLLHGFGFAGALSAVGLPRDAIAPALLLFNLGVELGQLLFIGACELTMQAFRRTSLRWPAWAEPVPAYAIGSLAAFWLIQRVAAF